MFAAVPSSPWEDDSQNLANECFQPLHSKASASAAMCGSHERILQSFVRAFLSNKCWPFVIAAKRPRPHYLAISIMPLHCHRYRRSRSLVHPPSPIALFVVSFWMKWKSAVDSLGVSMMGDAWIDECGGGLDHNKRIRCEVSGYGGSGRRFRRQANVIYNEWSLRRD